MEIKELTTSLVNQKNNLTSLLDAALQKQRALVNFDYAGLEESIVKEEKALSFVTEGEKGRIKVLSELYKRHSISNKTFKLSEFVENTKGMLDIRSQKQIALTEKELRELITRVSMVNQQNKFLIENSRAFIKDTVSAILNARRSLLDKKV
ncbi:MAG: flagellar protein FlgN [Ignavibacteria bacterium]|jgi:ABC-type phosphate/phosphonate transport system ATPase subunit|nr:flagellar protein FlgN [Ignavibacteria bacterium]MCU7525161.1 flagellar protein FlgN [Ignavibacteria bacterium]HEX2962046.1 flagellar export chaperone FlgN [Ignavibacteriales bacterium]